MSAEIGDEKTWAAFVKKFAGGDSVSHYGIDQARRGWFSKDDVSNTRPLSELKRLFGQRLVVKSGAARVAAH